MKYPYDSVVTFVFRNVPREVARSNVRILEVGSGTGNNLWFLAREGWSAYGIEGSASAVEVAKTFLKQDGLHAEIEVGNFTALPYSNNFFDLVIDRGSITCCGFAAGRKAITEVARVLKIGGKFFFNPYSENHSSFAAGDIGEDGVCENIQSGSMTGVGQICFYGKRQAIDALGDEFKIENIQKVEVTDVTEAANFVHSEWRIIASKVSLPK
ncbi:class I SAM-dependent methyltransferase [bacterium]|nr:class I SAM-dependent methyltransferase [bacterium]QQR59912.1 MAG: class I SAM-dependent methyltransferase [Candidatus Melainabacteria bacterium]